MKRASGIRSSLVVAAVLSALLSAGMARTAFAAPRAADDVAARFEAANRLYDHGRFAEAAAAYEAILASGRVSPALYFNLGNARFKAGQTGRALVAYRRAAERAPRDPDVLANLQFLREQVAGPTWRPGRLDRWLGRLTLNEWTWLAAGAFWAGLLLLAAGQVWPGARRMLRWPTRLALAAALFFGGALAAVWARESGATLAVVTVRETVAHNGPFEESPEAFRASDGAELRVLDRKEDWLQVSDGRGRPAWVRRDAVFLFKPFGSEV